MNIVSMNIRGLGGITKQKSLRTPFSSLNPDLIMLQETMCDHITALQLFAKLNPRWKFYALDAHGLFGGILSTWNPHLTCCKYYHSFVGILLYARFKGLDYVFSIINCYGPYANITVFWDCAIDGGIFNYPNLILAGDLKFTLSDLEVWGDRARLDHQVLYFAQLLDTMNMVDLDPTTLGPTWRNGRVGIEGVSKRLDRFLASIHLIPLLGSYHSWT